MIPPRRKVLGGSDWGKGLTGSHVFLLFFFFCLSRGARRQLTSKAIPDPIQHQREIDCACQSPLMSSTDRSARLPIWASHLEAFVGCVGKKKPLFQRARCYQTDTGSLLFIGKLHTSAHPLASFSPHQHPGGALAHSCNNPNFHGALLHGHSTYAPRDTPKPGPRGTFASPEGCCPTCSHPAARLDPTSLGSPQASGWQSRDVGGRKADHRGSACPEPSPALQLRLGKRFSSSGRSYFPHCVY